MHRAEVHAEAAVALQASGRQLGGPLPVVPLEGLPGEHDLLHEGPPQVRRQDRVGNAARQRPREERGGAHREGGDEPLVAGRRPLAADDIEELAALARLAEDRRAGEAGEHRAAGARDEGTEVHELVAELRLGADEIVHLVHDHDLVGIHVRVRAVESDLEQGARRQPVLLAQKGVLAASGSVPEGPERGGRQGLVGETAAEVVAPEAAHAAHVKAALHLEDLAHLATNRPKLLLAEVADVPKARPVCPPVLRPGSAGGAMRPQAAEVVAVLAGPAQHLSVEIAADGLLREDRDLRPGVVEEVVEHVDHLAGLA
mmetsp:Transcript_68705/g.210715  ORF Transcript_68705/g.210715 Transcript_68705/m.210715 type:complete len:314 (+) Transcript_68705:697-1638(+)